MEPDRAERRYLTILFADLVGYTALSERLEPEALRTLQLQYQAQALAIAERYGGFVAGFRGDGILAYFGFPTAHENDAERAVRAALELVECVPLLCAGSPDGEAPRTAVRIAVHTGPVVVGPETASMGRSEQGVVGEAANVAARIKDAAEPNTVLVSGATLGLIEGLFDSRPLGEWPIRGLSRPVPVHHVIGARHGAGRLPARWRRGATRMVGRQSALDQLEAEWDAVGRDGRCRIVEVIGEAGVGKSRLVLEFCEKQSLPEPQVLQANCLETFASTPLYPAAGLLWSRVGLRGGDDEPARHAKIAAFLRERGFESPEAVDALARLLGFAAMGAREVQQAAPAEIKRRQFSLITDFIGRIAQIGPTVVWVEDAHWIDPSSAELLRSLAEHRLQAPLLIVLTRRSFPPGLGLPEPDRTIVLTHLAKEQALELARAVPGAQGLPDRTLLEIVAAADGIPLFIEQLVISLLGHARHSGIGTRPDKLRPDQLVIPLTLAEMLSERLDRIEGSRRIVQAAACVGRSFTPGFLAALLGDDEADLLAPLESLVAAEILRRWSEPGRVEYEFRHALLHRVAYESILRPELRAVHGRIVGLLGRGEGLGPALPEVMAYHLTASGENAKAVASWLEAGTRAARLSANVEALDHLRRGLELLVHVSDPALRRALEMQIHAVRIASISATTGTSSAEMGACCRRGLELCLEGEPSPLVFPFLFGRFSFLMTRKRAREALEIAKLFLSMAERQDYSPGRVVGHRLVGMAHLGLGEAHRAREEVGRSLALYVPERDAAGTHVFGQNARVHGAALLSLTKFYLGEIESALDLGVEALRAADEMHHPHSTVIALAYVGGWVFGLCGAKEQMTEQARRLIKTAEQHQIGVFRNLGEVFLGWGLCQYGDLDQGITMLAQAIAQLDAVEFHLSMPGYLALLADAQRRRGLLADARATSERAVAMMALSDRWLEPEVMRVAALVADEDAPGAGRGLLRDAAASARQLGSPVLELRCLDDLVLRAASDECDAVRARMRELSAFGNLAAEVSRRLPSR